MILSVTRRALSVTKLLICHGFYSYVTAVTDVTSNLKTLKYIYAYLIFKGFLIVFLSGTVTKADRDE